MTGRFRCREPIPKAAATAVRHRAAGACEDCGRDGLRLELHHLTYRWQPDPGDGEEPVFGHETPADLAALCRDCHHARHVDLNGEFWADPEEKDAYWATSKAGR